MTCAIYVIIAALVLTLLIALLKFPKESYKHETISKDIIVSNRKLEASLEFKFVNLLTKPLEIHYEWNKSAPLKYIATIPASSCVYVYPQNLDVFRPGRVTLFSKFKEDPADGFALKPYTLQKMDYVVYFGESSTDFVRTKDIHSDRNEILSLYIENRSLKPYHVWYRGDYLGRLGAYHPAKKSIEYSMLTNNSEKHFQLGTWLEFMMDSPGSKTQAIQLRGKYITDVYVGDVVGRTEGNA